MAKKTKTPPDGIGEWLRDADEIAELFAAMGEELPTEAPLARERMLALLENWSQDRVVAALYEHSRQFAFMLEDIAAFCEDLGVTIAGQMQLSSSVRFGDRALDTAWAHVGQSNWTSDISNRASMLAGELSLLLQSINWNDLTQKAPLRPWDGVAAILSEYGLRDIGEAERHPIAAGKIRRARSAHRPQVCSVDDMRALQAALTAAEEVQSSLAELPTLPQASQVLDDLRRQVGSAIEQLQKVRALETAERKVDSTLSSAISLAGNQMRALAREASDAERAREGLHTFLRSEFWPARWRIFELWVFVRVLRTIERAGGVIRPIGVKDHVWILPYGQTPHPVAECNFSGRRLLAYYQLSVEAPKNDERLVGKKVDMPDIALFEVASHTAAQDTSAALRGLIPVAVLDPKHGPSHTSGSMEKVLIRYATRFPSRLTGVVNYTSQTDRRQFEELTGDPGRQYLLVSGMKPHTPSLRRLELRLEELLVTEYESISAEPRKTPTKRLHGGALLYWATRPNQIDEPKGAWIVPDTGVPKHLPAFTDALGEMVLTAAHSSATGKSLALVADVGSGRQISVFVLSGSAKPVRLAVPKLRAISWNLSGDRLLVEETEELSIHDLSGCEHLRLPRPEGNTLVWWARDGRTLLAFALTRKLDTADRDEIAHRLAEGALGSLPWVTRATLLAGGNASHTHWTEIASCNCGQLIFT